MNNFLPNQKFVENKSKLSYVCFLYRLINVFGFKQFYLFFYLNEFIKICFLPITNAAHVDLV